MINFRKTEASDIPTISTWIGRDVDHYQVIKPEFFVAEGEGISCYTIEDEQGPVIFVRQESEGEATRLHTQFPPVSGKRIVNALTEAYPLVAQDARNRGFKRVRFESGSIALVKFMFHMFGFRADLTAEL